MSFVNNSYTISPLVSELELEKPGTISTMVLDVLNEKDTKIKLQVRPKMWTIGPEGGLTYLETPVGFDLQKDIMISPREFELEPFQHKSVRFGVKRSTTLQDGEYRFQLAFEEAKLMPDFTETMKQNGVTAVINTKTILASTIYVHAGNTAAKIVMGDLQCRFQEDQSGLKNTIQVTNEGTKHARLLGVMVLNKKDSLGKFMPEKQVDMNSGGVVVLLPGMHKEVSGELLTKEELLKMTVGQYRADMTLMDERGVEPAMTKSCDITIP